MLIDRVSDPSVSVRAEEKFSAIAVSSLPEASARQGRRIGHRIDRHLHGVGSGLGVAASGLGRGRRHRQREVGIAVGRRRDGETDEIRRGQRLAAVAIEGALVERGAGQARDVDRQGLRPVGVGERRREAERDRRVLVAGGIGLVRVGASATALTVTRMVSVVVSVSPPLVSVEVAVTVSVKSASLLAGGVIVRPDEIRRGQRAAAAAIVRARLSVAPARPEMLIDRVSDPSVSVSADEKLSAIAVSSLPEASGLVSLGASATALTVTSTVSVVVSVSPPLVSVEVAVTVSVKSASLLAGGVMVRPTRSAAVSVQLPSPLWVPWLKRGAGKARDGDRQGLRTVGVGERRGEAQRDRRVLVAGSIRTVRVGASATALTVTRMVSVVVSVSPPVVSVAVAVTVSVKSASLLAGGVMVRPTRSAAVSV